jgi:uncharacterized protein YdiU (UPF0061 family)
MQSMAQLVDYALSQFPGPMPPEGAPGAEQPAIILLHQVIERLADMAASYVAAGFVHGVLNTDNMNITGESFDYGPWRWLPRWDADLPPPISTMRDAIALASKPKRSGGIADNWPSLCACWSMIPLIAALDRFDPLYQAALARRVLWRMGLKPLGDDRDAMMLAAAGQHMREEQLAPDTFFHMFRGAPCEATSPLRSGSPLAAALASFEPVPDARDHCVWQDVPPDNHIETVENLWMAIDRDDDWTPLYRHVDAIRALGDALGQPPIPAGHIDGSNT